MGKRRLARAAKLVRTHGVAGGARLAVESLRARFQARRDGAFDRRYGTDTGGIIPVDALGALGDNVRHSARYQATTPGFFHRMVRGLRLRLREFTFVDLGSGKGRAVMLAARYRFRRVIGVEYAPALHAVAEENARRFAARALRAPPVELLCADVVDFEFPDEPLVVYLYNPFGPPVLSVVLERLRASLARAPRRAFVLYRNPRHAHVLDRCDFLTLRAATADWCAYAARSL